MTLPHPHGNSSGQIAHNSSYDTGDTPGSTGGKFIGFGEQGTSEIANRPHWALSENIDFIYDILAADKAIPAVDAFTIGVGGESTHQITGSVWCGDSGYPADATEGLQLLFNVLDDQYNELLDTNGYEVVVAVVRDSGNVTDQYKDGFETDPVVTFKTIDSTGADVQNPYTIPAGTDVRLTFGLRGSLENLPIDAFTKFKIQSGDEAPAGVFRTDGTAPMTGNANWAGFDINNIGDLVGKTAQDVLLRSMQDLNFQDQYAGPIPFSQAGQTGFLGTLNASLLGNINSNIQLHRALMANRTLVKNGAITFTDVSGLVTLPAGMVVSVNGEAVNVGGQSYTATNGSFAWGVINASGVFVERTTAPLATDTPVAYHNWNGSAFTTKYDIRWDTNGASGNLVMTVSTENPNADFSDLQTAVNAMSALHNYVTGMVSPVSYVIEIIDSVNVTSTVTITKPLTIRGSMPAEPDSSLAMSAISCNLAAGSHVFDCGQATVHIENLSFVNNGVNHNASIIRDPGWGSVLRHLHFKSWVGYWKHGITWGSGLNLSDSHILIENCRSIRLKGTVVDSSAATNLSQLTIRNFNVDANGDTVCGFNVPFEGNTIENCRLGGVTSGSDCIDGPGIILGPNSTVHKCWFIGSSSADTTNIGVRINPTTSTSWYTYADLFYQITGCFFRNLYKAMECAFTAAGSQNVHVKFESNSLFQCAYGPHIENVLSALGAGTSYSITGNHFTQMSSTRVSVYLDTARNVTVEGNLFTDCDGTPVKLIQHNRAVITGNIFESYRLGPSADYAIEVLDSSSTDEECLIQGNIFTGNGGASAPTCVRVDASNVTIDGNQFGADTNVIDTGVYMVSGIGNKITNNTFRRCVDKSIFIDMHLESEPHGYVLISGNTFTPPDHVLGVASIYILGTPGCVIRNNHFVGDRTDVNQDGMAIYVNDLTRAVHGTVIQNNTFRHIVGYLSSQSSYRRVIWIQGDNGGLGANATNVSGNYFDECGDNAALGSTYQRIMDIEGDAYTIENNVIKDSYGPQSSSSYQQLIYCTGAVFDYCNVNYNKFIETGPTSSGRITLGAWTAIKTSSVGIRCIGNSFHTIELETGISANGTSEIFLDIPGGIIINNYMSVRARSTISGTTAFINATVAAGSQFVGNRCEAALYHMTVNGDRCVLIGNACTNTISGTNIACAGEQILAIGNAATGTMAFTGGATSPGLVIGNIVYGGGATSTGSHNTSGNL